MQHLLLLFLKKFNSRQVQTCFVMSNLFGSSKCRASYTHENLKFTIFRYETPIKCPICSLLNFDLKILSCFTHPQTNSKARKQCSHQKLVSLVMLDIKVLELPFLECIDFCLWYVKKCFIFAFKTDTYFCHNWILQNVFISNGSMEIWPNWYKISWCTTSGKDFLDTYTKSLSKQ